MLLPASSFSSVAESLEGMRENIHDLTEPAFEGVTLEMSNCLIITSPMIAFDK